MSNSEVRRFNEYIDKITPISTVPYDFTDKERCNANHITYMLNRTHSMFKYENLPETITSRIIELYLQINGHLCFHEYKDDLYVFVGGLGGEPNVYYMPTLYVIANPALNYSASLVIDKECVVVPNDTMYRGLIPLFARYATMLTENELSMKLATVNTRISALLSASDDRTYESAKAYLQDIEDGKLGVIAENGFFDGIKAQPVSSVSNSNYLTNLIEFEQYCKASWFNEIGLDANYNMKRESLNSAESQMNNDALLPLIDDMLEQREKGIEKVNKMYGTNIKVSLSSSWEDNKEELEILHENIISTDTEENESEVNENGNSDD